uniref:RRM domain-containing protein n=1 Tax=Ditylenchus dipsaci TaxID=166011 RepID=A0A915EBW0_9BILA
MSSQRFVNSLNGNYPLCAPPSPIGYAQGYSGVALPEKKYVPNRIFVGGLSPDTTEDDLREFFNKFADVASVNVVKDFNGISKKFGFVTFESSGNVSNTILAANPQQFVLKNCLLRLGPAMKQNFQPGNGFPSVAGQQSMPPYYLNQPMPYYYVPSPPFSSSQTFVYPSAPQYPTQYQHQQYYC